MDNEYIIASFTHSESLQSELQIFSSIEVFKEALLEKVGCYQDSYTEGAVMPSIEEIETFVDGLSIYESYLSLFQNGGYECAVTARIYLETPTIYEEDKIRLAKYYLKHQGATFLENKGKFFIDVYTEHTEFSVQVANSDIPILSELGLDLAKEHGDYLELENFKIKDRKGIEVEIDKVVLLDDEPQLLLGGFARGNGEFIPFKEWSYCYYRSEEDEEATWHFSLDFQAFIEKQYYRTTEQSSENITIRR